MTWLFDQSGAIYEIAGAATPDGWSPCINADGEPVAPADGRARWDAVARVFIEPSRAERAAAITLTAAEFWSRFAAAAALQDDEAPIRLWTAEQLKASAIPPAQRRAFLTLLEAATHFPRIDPELGDVLASLGALFGLTPAQVDDMFLGDIAVVIDRADCPLATVEDPAVTAVNLQAALEAALDRIRNLEGGT